MQGSLKAISFHPLVKGRLITLSEGGRRVTRDKSSFCNGLTFSARPVRREERVCLRIHQSVGHWRGSLRVGFTHVSPEQTTLPPLAIPDLTRCPLYAAVVVPDAFCGPDSEIHFWLKRDGRVRVKSSDGRKYSESSALNARCPVWAIIDVYGQTTAVTMLGEPLICEICMYNIHKQSLGTVILVYVR
ncbi:hypothetical protein DNTS_020949 [Danionella cerebrum]|uniref:NHR domain-containing protein n=1 Tax=Danionella cerebrum TaxID=2873325 RepID=A0A553QU21_9TELE|nr:hypothetical protein DNTS_020949 [Danionella translucida]